MFLKIDGISLKGLFLPLIWVLDTIAANSTNKTKSNDQENKGVIN